MKKRETRERGWNEEREEGKAKGGQKKRSLPQISSYRIRDFKEQHSWRIYDPQTLDGSDVLRQDELRVRAWVEQTFSVSRKVETLVSVSYGREER